MMICIGIYIWVSLTAFSSQLPLQCQIMVGGKSITMQMYSWCVTHMAVPHIKLLYTYCDRFLLPRGELTV